MDLPQITLKSYRKIEKGCLMGECTILVPIAMNQVNHWREEVYTIFKRKDNSGFFLKYPSKEYTNKDGEKKEAKLVSWKEKEGDNIFLSKILSLCGLDKQKEMPF